MLFICLLVLTLTSGCWDHRELNELSIVLAVGIDQVEENKIELTLQIARPRSFVTPEGAQGGMAAPTTWIISETGHTVFDAVDKLSLKVSREFHWSHGMLTIFNDEAASNIVKFDNFIYRFPGTRETMNIFITPGKAKDILESNSALENTSAQSLFAIARQKRRVRIQFTKFARDLYTLGNNAVAPRVELVRAGSLEGVGLEIPRQHHELAITGTALFKADKFAGYINLDETYGLAWLEGRTLRAARLTAPGIEDESKKISFLVIRNHIMIDPVYEDGKIKFLTSIFIEGNLVEQQGDESLLDLENIKKLERNIAGVITEQVEDFLRKSKGEYGTDAVGFGEAFGRKYRKEWKKFSKNWDEKFTQSEIYLNVDVSIRETGNESSRPLLRKGDRK